jgi:hypothetical protein
MNPAQRKASKVHRERAKARGLTRIEVQAHAHDTALIRAVAETLRSETDEASRLRRVIAELLPAAAPNNAFNVFGSDLPDSAFHEVLDQPRHAGWREVEL